jgi:hypothetical protein
MPISSGEHLLKLFRGNTMTNDVRRIHLVPIETKCIGHRL